MSEIGDDEEEMVGVLPTLLPKRPNAVSAVRLKAAICRDNAHGPSGTRTQDLGIKRLLTGMSDCVVWCRCVRPERHPEVSAVVYVLLYAVAWCRVRLHDSLHLRPRCRSGGETRRAADAAAAGRLFRVLAAGGARSEVRPRFR